MDRLVTPPRQGPSPTRGPPPPCEKALSFVGDQYQASVPLGQTLNHTTFDVYTLNTAETRKMLRIFCEILSFDYIKALDSKGIRSCLLRQHMQVYICLKGQ